MANTANLTKDFIYLPLAPVAPIARYFHDKVVGVVVVDSIGRETRTLYEGGALNFSIDASEFLIPSPTQIGIKVTALDSDNNILNTGDFYIYYATDGGGMYGVRVKAFPKKIWNVKIWESTKTPTDEEIRSTFAEDSWAWYRCDEMAGIIVLDATGNMRHAFTEDATRTTQPLFSWHNRYGYNAKADYVANGWTWQTEQGWALDDNAIIGQSGLQGGAAVPFNEGDYLGNLITVEMFTQGFDILNFPQQKWGRAKYNALMSTADLDGQNTWGATFSTQTLTLPKVPDLIQSDILATYGLGFYFNPLSNYDAVPKVYADIKNNKGGLLFANTSNSTKLKKEFLIYAELLGSDQLLTIAKYQFIKVLFYTSAPINWDDTKIWDDNAMYLARG